MATVVTLLASDYGHAARGADIQQLNVILINARLTPEVSVNVSFGQ